MKPFIHNLSITKTITTFAVVLLLSLAQLPVQAKTLNEAVKTAGKGGKSKVISARTVNKGQKRTHEVRVLTKRGKLKTVRYPANRKSNSIKSPPKHHKGKGGK